MTCPSCGDCGVFRVSYREDDGADPDYALCLCRAGELMRKADNCGKPTNPQWHIWASTNGIPFDRVFPMEDLLTAEEMAERGFTELKAATALDAVVAAARARGAKR